MHKLLKFVKPGEETVLLHIPQSMKGKLIEITMAEKAPDDDTDLDPESSEHMAHKEIELQIIDKMQSQLSVWDI